MLLYCVLFSTALLMVVCVGIFWWFNDCCVCNPHISSVFLIKNAPQKSNIDTKYCHFKRVLPFPRPIVLGIQPLVFREGIFTHFGLIFMWM